MRCSPRLGGELLCAPEQLRHYHSPDKLSWDEWRVSDREVEGIGLENAANPGEADKLEEMTDDEMAVDGYYVVAGIARPEYKQGWNFPTLWDGYELSEATWEPMSAFIQPDGSIHPIFRSYQREQGSRMTRPETRHTTQQPPRARHKEQRTAWSTPGQSKAGHHTTTRSTEHGNTAPQNTRRKGSTARRHQAAQGTTRTPGGARAGRENHKQAGRSKTAEENHRTPSGNATTTAKHTPWGGGTGTAEKQPKARQKTQKQQEHREHREGKARAGRGGGGTKSPEEKNAKKGKRKDEKEGWGETNCEPTGPRQKAEKGSRGVGGRQGNRTAPRPKAPGAGNRGKQETAGAQWEKKKGNKKSPRKERTKTKGQERGKPSPAGGQAKQEDDTAKGKVGRTKTRPEGRPAQPCHEAHTHADTHGTRAWRSPARKWPCRCPHKTAPVHRPSSPSKDGWYGEPDASVTGSTHTNHRSACSLRPTQEQGTTGSRGSKQVRRRAS